jgi:predicted tellurium resistance membrane protein TerC
MSEFFTTEALSALLQVIMIDLVLAGDNAIVIGLAAAGLPKEQRAKAILIGIIAATVLRIGFAAATTQLLQIVGLLLAGGILLLWVCWKMWRELRTSHTEEIQGEEALEGRDLDQDGKIAGSAPRKTFAQAAWRHCRCVHVPRQRAGGGGRRPRAPERSDLGLILSIALMGVAASFIARLLQKHRWIAYVGLVIILYVSVEMIYRGTLEVWPLVNGG